MAWGRFFEERKDNQDLLKKVYGLRSQVVHSGTLRNPQSAQEVLRQGIELCARLIRTIIERGSVPDWDAVILTADPDLPPREDAARS